MLTRSLPFQDSPPDWQDLLYFARLIPRVCHNVNRVCYVFGGRVEHPVQDVTPSFLTPLVVSTLRQADHVANQSLKAAKVVGNISQMPVVRFLRACPSQGFYGISFFPQGSHSHPL